jgi:hypothetical protein
VTVERETREAALDALRAELEAKGVSVKEGSWGYRLLMVDDPDGNQLFFNYPNETASGKIVGDAKASQIADSGISNFTFLRSIGTAASVWPIPLLRGTDATFSFSPGSLQVSLSAIVGICRDGFSDWLAANGYTRVSRQSSIRMLPNVDVDLRRRQVEELANLPNCSPQLLTNSPQGPSFPSKNSADNWNDIWPRTA